jgi:RNA-dependent RNA polymerase
MRDCIVFPTIGPRPHSDEISGSDLDGDQYWVYWGQELKIDKPIEPLSHSPADKLTVPNITNEMVIDYFLHAIGTNCYSRIADIHTVVADQTEKGTLSTECVELATLFYRAIDSPKTGEIIKMDEISSLKDRCYTKFPKFMMKFDQPYYESTSILEKLYLKAKKIHLKGKDRYKNYQIASDLQTGVPSSTAVVANIGLQYLPLFLS